MSEKSYLLDTNSLIYLLENTVDVTSQEKLRDVQEKLSDSDSEFFLTPLIRYEVLRGIAWEDREKLAKFQDALAEFDMLDISREVADLARELYRFDKFSAAQRGQSKNLEKRKFDMFHYATAKINDLKFDGYICGCGTQIHYNDNIIFEKDINQNKCFEIATMLRKYNITGIFEGKNAIYFDDKKPLTKELVDIKKMFISQGIDVSKNWDDENLDFSKFVIWFNEKSDNG